MQLLKYAIIGAGNIGKILAFRLRTAGPSAALLRRAFSGEL